MCSMTRCLSHIAPLMFRTSKMLEEPDSSHSPWWEKREMRAEGALPAR